MLDYILQVNLLTLKVVDLQCLHAVFEYIQNTAE